MVTGEGHDATPGEGAQGPFDGFADATLGFSKQHEGRFPEEDELVAALAAR